MFAEMNSDLHTLIKESYRLHSSWILELPEIDQSSSHASEVLKDLITLELEAGGQHWQQTLCSHPYSEHPRHPVATSPRREGGLWAAAVKLYREGSNGNTPVVNNGSLAIPGRFP